MARKKASSPARSGPLVLGLASLKGGVGKTTSAVHLAGALALEGLEVVLLDGDRIRTATAWASREKLPFRVVSPTALARAGEYDALVIDSRGGADAGELLEVAQTADLLILPSPADLSGLDGIGQTVELLSSGNIPPERYAALLTRVRPGPRAEQARAGLAQLNVPTFETQIRESVAFQDAINQGVLVKDIKDSRTAQTGWEDYRQVTAEAIKLSGWGA
ncbi:ParA family protein [Deinococcus fonticola]|uniref:ParA family protein n=1 Tax=Deinococcus fonticola TaxID=2528713 RepID=UPI001074B1D1|nr:ParA family protein [Deinococcus fonticola]